MISAHQQILGKLVPNE